MNKLVVKYITGIFLIENQDRNFPPIVSIIQNDRDDPIFKRVWTNEIDYPGLRDYLEKSYCDPVGIQTAVLEVFRAYRKWIEDKLQCLD